MCSGAGIGLARGNVKTLLAISVRTSNWHDKEGGDINLQLLLAQIAQYLRHL